MSYSYRWYGFVSYKYLLVGMSSCQQKMYLAEKGWEKSPASTRPARGPHFLLMTNNEEGKEFERELNFVNYGIKLS